MIVFLRFLKPSQVRGIDTEAFLRQQLIASNIHEQAILGYRGLVGNHTYFILADHQPTKINRSTIYIIYTYIYYQFHSTVQTRGYRSFKDFSHIVNSVISRRCSFININISDVVSVCLFVLTVHACVIKFKFRLLVRLNFV